MIIHHPSTIETSIISHVSSIKFDESSACPDIALGPSLRRVLIPTYFLILLPRPSSRKMSSGCHHEHRVMDHAVEQTCIGVIRKPISIDNTQSPAPLTAPFDFADWILFPEELAEDQGLPETDEPPSTRSWRCGSQHGTQPLKTPRITSKPATTSTQTSLLAVTHKSRKSRVFKVAKRHGVKVREMRSAGNAIERSEEETPTPRTPRPQRLPTPDLSDLEQDNLWACCTDIRATHPDEERCGAFELIENDVPDFWYVMQTASAKQR